METVNVNSKKRKERKKKKKRPSKCGRSLRKTGKRHGILLIKEPDKKKGTLLLEYLSV